MSILSTVLTVAQQVNPESEFRSFLSSDLGQLISALMVFAGICVLIGGIVMAIMKAVGGRSGGGKSGALRMLLMAVGAAAFLMFPQLWGTLASWALIIIRAIAETVGDVFSRA